MKLFVRYVLLGLLLVAGPVVASAETALAAWVPAGWKQVARATGDLTKDGADDEVLVLEQTAAANLKLNDSLGASQLNLNPRRLLILANTAAGYQPLLSRDDLLPSEHDAEAPCLADPLLEQGGIAVRGGKLMITLGYWLSCGSYGVTTNHFTLRLEGQRLRLIGYDMQSFSRNSGEISETSINYLTAKKKTTSGKNEFEDSTAVEEWSKLADLPKFYLDEMRLDCFASDEPGCGWDR